MTDKYKYYVVCHGCNGTGFLSWGFGEGYEEGDPGAECPICHNDIDVRVFDGLRHIYAGRFEEVV